MVFLIQIRWEYFTRIALRRGRHFDYLRIKLCLSFTIYPDRAEGGLTKDACIVIRPRASFNAAETGSSL